MAIETIEFKGEYYPALQAKGFAAQYAFPFASKICTPPGSIYTGYDIGCNREEWKFPGSIAIDPAIEGCGFDAYNLPPMQVDYIFSSHCLEHLPNYVSAIEYWSTVIRSGGVLFLYLPNCEYQEYWRPWNNKKHIHLLSPNLIRAYFESNLETWTNVCVTDGYDLNGSFYAIAQKK